MAEKYYEVDIQFRETGTGQAEIIVPQVLTAKAWHYVQIHGDGQKALVEVDASDDEQAAIAADNAIRSLTKGQVTERQKAYPAPKLKRRYPERTAQLIAEEGKVEGATGAPVLETFQTVRWRFYLIDVPVSP
jgi:hypothetical protein